MIRLYYLTTIFIFFFTNLLFAQVYGELNGVVTDQTGTPIFGASVYLEGTQKGAQTNQEGKYSITNIEPGSYNLIASYLGYKTQTKYNVIVKSKGTPAYNFVLTELVEALDEVEVTNASRISKPKETPLSTQTLSAVEIATYPGSNNDVVQVAQTLPGVSPSIGGFRNDLIIRGGAPNETVYYLDGVEVPNINHFSTQGSAGGPVGMINVSFIDDVILSASAFGAQYDNPLSGVLQFKQRIGNTRNFAGNFRLSASEAALSVEGPLFKGKKAESNTSYLVSVRRSYLQFLFKVIGLPFRPSYWDYQYKINHKINEYNTLSLIGLGSIDDFSVEAPADFDAEQQAQLEQAPFINQKTNTIGLTWKKRFKDGSGFMQTTLSTNRLQNKFTKYEDAENQTGVVFANDAVESETKLRYLVTKFYDEFKLSAGFNTQYSKYKNNTINNVYQNTFNSEIDFVKYGLFANVTRSFLNNRLDVSVGFRLDDDTFTTTDHLLRTFSPRAAISYEFIDNWKINATAGRYFKLPPYTILGFKDNNNTLVNKDVSYTTSNHFVLGVEHYFTPSASFSVEAFYKKYEDYPISVVDQVSLANKGAGFEVLGSEDVATTGSGRAYGTELLFQQKLSKNFYGIFSYTWFFSEFTGLNNNKYVPSVWDSRHLISFTGGYKLNNNWEISSRYRFAGKTPYAPVDLEATQESYPEIILDYTRLGEVKLDVFSQLDVRIDKKWNFKDLSLNIFVEAQNLLKQQIPQPTEYGLARDENGQVIEPKTLVPIVTDTSSIIPSFGVVLDF